MATLVICLTWHNPFILSVIAYVFRSVWHNLLVSTRAAHIVCPTLHKLVVFMVTVHIFSLTRHNLLQPLSMAVHVLSSIWQNLLGFIVQIVEQCDLTHWVQDKTRGKGEHAAFSI